MTENLQKILENLKFDKRMTDWYMRRGLLTKEELEKHLNSLEDCSDLAIAFDLDDDKKPKDMH